MHLFAVPDNSLNEKSVRFVRACFFCTHLPSFLLTFCPFQIQLPQWVQQFLACGVGSRLHLTRVELRSRRLASDDEAIEEGLVAEQVSMRAPGR